MPSFPSRVPGAAAVVAAVLMAVSPGGAARAPALPVNYDFVAGSAAAFLAPDTPPPGADNFTCKPSAAHPYPVILVHGTFGNMDDNWQAASPLLADHGYCVFAFNYGGASATSPSREPVRSRPRPRSSRRSSAGCWRRPEHPRSTWSATPRAA